MIDKIIEVEMPNRIVAKKNVTINEPYFVGHFPGYPIMPGVLIAEAIAQTASALISFSNKSTAAEDDGIYVLGVIKKLQFKRSVYPGDQLIIEVLIEKLLKTRAIVSAEATNENGPVASGILMFARKEKEL